MDATIEPFGIELEDPTREEIDAVAGLLAEELEEPAEYHELTTVVMHPTDGPLVDPFQDAGWHTSVAAAVGQVVEFLTAPSESMTGVEFHDEPRFVIQIEEEGLLGE